MFCYSGDLLKTIYVTFYSHAVNPISHDHILHRLEWIIITTQFYPFLYLKNRFLWST